ncbi:MAG: Ig domain-containing protein [Clostridia bacterium]|nr:Ig domain-containing protein [Clostridia bacterium]
MTFEPKITSGSHTTFTWTTSNKAVAIVSKGGKITAKKAGKANITVTAHNGRKAVLKVTVAKAPARVSLNKTTASLQVGDTLRLKATLPKGTASSKLTWKSTNTDVVTVTEKGTVTAVGSGTAKISVTTYNGKKAICKVTVEEETPEPAPKPTPKILTLSGDLPQKLSMGFYPTKQEYMIDSFKCEVVECDDDTYQYKFSFGGVKTKDIDGDFNFTQYPINWELYGYIGDNYVLIDRGVIKTPLVRVGDRWSMDSCYGMTNIKLQYNSSIELSVHLSIHTVLS